MVVQAEKKVLGLVNYSLVVIDHDPLCMENAVSRQFKTTPEAISSSAASHLSISICRSDWVNSRCMHVNLNSLSQNNLTIKPTTQ
jgi:hypothetical protein